MPVIGVLLPSVMSSSAIPSTEPDKNKTVDCKLLLPRCRESENIMIKVFEEHILHYTQETKLKKKLFFLLFLHTCILNSYNYS